MNNFIVVDGHSDYPVQVFREHRNGNTHVIENKHLPSCTAGGVVMEVITVGGDFSSGIWDGRDPVTVLKTIACIYREVGESQESLSLVLKKKDLEQVGKNGNLSMMLNLEGATCITQDFPLLKHYYDLGVRAMGLTHNHENIYAHGCVQNPGLGLTDMGKLLVEEINKYGIVLDLAHINERGFFQALDLAERPPVVSHSNAKKLCNSCRNLTDDQLKALSDRGGVVGLNCLGCLIDESLEKQTIDRLLDHLDYIVDLIGIGHVGFGPDYINPSELQFAIDAPNISNMPKFVDGLLSRGYADPEIKKIMSENFLRVYRQNLPE